ncbi:ribosome-associated translation inhibitor RaiA [Marivirga sp. S37H4]|uniref:Ribosome-associated translation inhibitor RaiA n=1 Tax=Marivirga aurantiaca TaxID=2802615 RepID=A0A934X2A8_9BACT|nr:HPF/RaiA family ribosome-associated protein [Marivirga aurantiaca]MBK6266986.1 ribosome-associated translation inhibitor RaiA [Marivirga aurantiaca]
MNITLEPVNFNISPELDNRVREMFSKLSKFNDQIVGIDLYLKSVTESNIDEKVVEAKVFLPGNDIFVMGKGESFITASQDCYDVAKRNVRKAKERLKDRHEIRPDKL